MSNQEHWKSIYAVKAADQVSWYRPHLDRSLRIIDNAGLPRAAAFIDVGGGTSTLVDDLLARGYSDITVLDVSAAAMAHTRARLGGAGADSVKWIVGDVTVVDLPEKKYAFWHDRAVFHFLRDPEQRRRYVAAALRALMPGGHILIATFGPGGPRRCSGLDVVRYAPDDLHAEFGNRFRKVASETEMHTTPWGTEQEFVYCYWRFVP